MDINFGFEAAESDLSNKRVMPAGEYLAQLIDVNQIQARSGNMRTSMTFHIMDGEYKGNETTLYFNIGHSNEKAREIAERQVKQMGAAMGVIGSLSSSAMLKKPFVLALKQKEYNGNVSNDFHYAAKLPDMSPAQIVDKKDLHKGLDDDIPF